MRCNSQTGLLFTVFKKSDINHKMSFGLSLLYNLVGLSFAVTGKLDPLAAIIMPLSTITIVSFVTIMVNYYAILKKK
jgi:Cu+-exporting ATPase